MKENYKLYLYLLLLSCLMGCSSSMSSEEYILWMKDEKNGLRQVKQVNGFAFDVQYLPSQYRFISQRAGNSANALTHFVREQAGVQYFNLTISHEGNKDLITSVAHNTIDEQNILYYLSYNFQKDIYLEACGQKIPCSLFHFERSYDMKKSRTFVLGFESDCVETDAFKLVLDPKILPTGLVKVKINTEDIPELKL